MRLANGVARLPVGDRRQENARGNAHTGGRASRPRPKDPQRPKPAPARAPPAARWPGRAGRSRGFPSPRVLAHLEAASADHNRRSAGLSAQGSQSAPAPSPALGRRIRPSGCRGPQSTVRPSVRRGAPSGAARGAPGLGARRRRDGGRRGRGAGRSGTGARCLYRPTRRASAACPRGSGSCTIVSGRSAGSRRAPGPALSRPCHPREAPGVAARLRPKLRAPTAAAGPGPRPCPDAASSPRALS